MTRTAIRELAFRLIYSFEIQNTDKQEQIDLYLEVNNITSEKAVEYIKNTVNGIIKNEEYIISLIEKNLKADWSISRLSKIDLSLLKLAIYEIKYEEIPFKVVINEVVELAKKYGEDSSKSFINGIMANIIKEIGE